MSKLLPVGAQTYSKAPDRYPEGAPPTIGWANGAWVADEDPGEVDWGGEIGLYVDLTSGLGAVILGHRHPAVEEAVRHQLSLGVSYPLPSKLEEKVAKRLLDCLTWKRAESVRFGKNGSDVTGSAVRLARAATGREWVLYNGYHGHHDWSMGEPPMNGGIVEHPSHKIYWDPAAPWLTLTALKESFAVEPVAALVLEAVPSAHPIPMTREFWRRLRELCDQFGVLLVIDEMVTGFRMAVGGACEVGGIEPDIACYGKAIANGLPLSAIVGPWDLLKRYEEDVFFSTTHGGETLSLAAADATMKVIKEEDVPLQLAGLGAEIQDAASGSWGYRQRVLFKYSPEQLKAMLSKGVLTAGYANLTLAHITDHVARERIFSAISAAEALWPTRQFVT